MTAYIDDLNEVRGSAWSWRILGLTLLCWVPAQIIWFGVVSLFPGLRQLDYFETPLRAVTLALLLAPILETQVMRFNFWVLKKLTNSRGILLTANALIWGGMHLHSESWGLPAVWGFLIMGAVFLKLSERSMDRAVLVTTGIHILFNTMSYTCYLLFERH